MTPGQITRRVLGPAFGPVSEVYRRIFVNMPTVAAEIAKHIPPGAQTLDIGGGDGYLANLLLIQRPDIRVTITDLSANIGGLISQANESRCMLLPKTGIRDVKGRFDAIILSDVLHHIPVHERAAFCTTLCRVDTNIIIVKEFAPGGFRSKLGLWADHYISGERQVRFIAANDLTLPGFARAHYAIPDAPNYVVVFHRQ